MSGEGKVAGHYTRGTLEETILQALTRAGHDPDQLKTMDLATVDEFHIGGLEATKELGAQMELRPGLLVLDVGSGIGGPARYFAAEHQCKVTGIDLTEEFVRVARTLTRRTKLEHLVEFAQASALHLGLQAGTFDRAYMIHVGMNISDKAGVFREVRRVLKHGGNVCHLRHFSRERWRDCLSRAVGIERGNQLCGGRQKLPRGIGKRRIPGRARKGPYGL